MSTNEAYPAATNATTEALRASELRYRRLFESARDGILVLNAETGMIVDVNPFLVELLGISHESFLGKKVWQLGFLKDIVANEDKFSELQAQKYIRYENLPLETADGRPIAVEFVSNVYLVNGDRVIQCNIRDITERKRAEEVMRRQNAILEGINEVLEVALTCQTERDLGASCLDIAQKLTQSKIGFIGEINERGMEDIAISNPGWDACDIIETGGHRRTDSDFKIHGIYGCVISTGKALFTNDPSNHPDHIGLPGGHPPVETFLAAPLIREGRTIGLIAVANRPGGYTPAEQDALEALVPSIVEAFMRKRAEEALRRSAEELARSNEDLEQFARVASHDLQEPLREVCGFLKLLQERYESQLDDKAKEFIGYSVEGATRMSQLITDLLAYSRVDRNSKEVRPTDSGKALAAAMANLNGSIQEAGVTVFHEELPMVQADSWQLLQLFQNLVGNSIKFRSPDRPCQVRIAARAECGQWLFSVQDNGIGIPREAFERVFVIFQRLHIRKKYKGTGIGLAICKKIVERHGGKIWIESKVGEGTTFYFTLPVGAHVTSDNQRLGLSKV